MAKVLVSVDAALLRRIDRAAKARGLSRSAYLAQLAARDLEVIPEAGLWREKPYVSLIFFSPPHPQLKL